MIDLLPLVAVDALLGGQLRERFLAAQRQHEILARDAELACDTVDRAQRDALDRLPQPVRIG